MGWSKATKLEGRQTSQGLIAVSVKGNTGVMVELNCETDFVARNKNFQEMAEKAANACFLFVTKSRSQSPLTKVHKLNNSIFLFSKKTYFVILISDIVS